MTLIENFKKYGFLELENIFSIDEINSINIKADPIIKDKFNKKKTEIILDELVKSGIADIVMTNKKLRRMVLEILPDPILFGFNIYEVDTMQKRTHTSDNSTDGWHVDTPVLPFLDRKQPNFISLMVYLTDVLDFQDGPFEVTSENTIENINHSLQSKKILGSKGTSFIWNNNYIHRASPNSGKIRRRVLKIGFQNNYLQSSLYPSMQNSYTNLLKKDEFTDFIFGKFHFTSIKAHKIDHLLAYYKNPIYYKKLEYNTSIKLNKIFRFKKLIKNFFN